MQEVILPPMGTGLSQSLGDKDAMNLILVLGTYSVTKQKKATGLYASVRWMNHILGALYVNKFVAKKKREEEEGEGEGRQEGEKEWLKQRK